MISIFLTLAKEFESPHPRHQTRDTIAQDVSLHQ